MSSEPVSPAKDRPLPSIVELAALGVVLAVAALGFIPVFAGRGAAVPLVLAAILPLGLARSLARTPPAARLAASLVAWVFFTMVAAYRSAVALGSVIGGVTDGASRLLTTTVPVEPRGDELAIVLFVVWAASITAYELALRRQRGLMPTMPPVALLAIALVAGGGGGPMPVVIPLLVVTGVGAVGLLRSEPEAPLASRGRRVVAGLAVVAVLALAATVAGPRLPGAAARPRYDPRSSHDPFVASPAVSPLVSLAAAEGTSDEILFTVRAPREGQPWRLATLDRFDGQLWSSAATYRRSGRVLPGDKDIDVARKDFEQEVSIERLDGFFVPAAPRPSEISVEGLGVDPDSGTLLVPRGRDLPRRYRVVSSLPQPTAEQLRLAPSVPPSTSEPRVPSVPASLRQLADQVTADAASAFGKMAALQQFFRNSGFTYDKSQDAPSGHSFFHIDQLVNNRRGTAEQYASAFAVMARSLGYDSRVGVGFRANQFDQTTSTYTVRAGDAHAWPEVHFDGVGWVAFEPSPLDQLAGPDQPAPPQPLPALDEAIPDGVKDPIAPGAANGGDRGPGAGRGDGGRGPMLAVVAASLLLLVVLAAPLTVIAVKAARRRRWRRSATPAGQVVGAWREAVDRLRERRLPVTSTMTSVEVVSIATGSLGPSAPTALRPLAQAADSALFGAEAIDPQAADWAWRSAREITAELKKGLSPGARAWAAVSPLPLLPQRSTAAPRFTVPPDLSRVG